MFDQESTEFVLLIGFLFGLLAGLLVSVSVLLYFMWS